MTVRIEQGKEAKKVHRLRMMKERLLINNDGWSSFDPVDSEILERLSKKNSLAGEDKLMLAVPEKAIEYFQKYALANDHGGKKLFQEAEEWILDKDSDWLYFFENISEVLGLHPNYLRQGQMCWKEARLKHHANRLKFHRTR